MNLLPPPANKQRATITDVARLSGVAKATVSKALDTSSRYGLSNEVRQRVIQAATQLGYKPGGRGRAASEASSRVIGLFYSRATPLPSDLYEHMICAAADVLTARHCRFVHMPLLGEPATWKELLTDRRVVGGIIIDPIDKAVEGLLRGITLRCVLLNVYSELPSAQVTTDFLAGGMVLAQHLLELGHRQIAFCQGTAPSTCWGPRKEGCRSALSATAGLASASPAMLPDQFVAQWANVQPQPTAVITDTMTTAIELLEDCRHYGIRVPHDLSVATFDDAYPSEHLSPPLTAMRTPAEQLGREAASLLVDQIDGEQSSAPRKILIPESLVVRKSTAAHRSR